MKVDRKLLDHLEVLSRKAGDAIASIYESEDWDPNEKDDGTPVTRADMEAHRLVVEGLKQFELPIVSEEDPDSHRIQSTHSWWCVDPLDGTRAFIKKKTPFTVNIALIQNNESVAGVVCDPLGDLYAAGKGMGVYKNSEKLSHIPYESGDGYLALTSRHHGLETLEEFFKNNPPRERVKMPSSLKFCLLSDGGGDVYPRLSPTHEWDTAAGQVICEQGGCQVIDLQTGKPMRYGKDKLLNGSFIAFRNGMELSWPAVN